MANPKARFPDGWGNSENDPRWKVVRDIIIITRNYGSLVVGFDSENPKVKV